MAGGRHAQEVRRNRRIERLPDSGAQFVDATRPARRAQEEEHGNDQVIDCSSAPRCSRSSWQPAPAAAATAAPASERARGVRGARGVRAPAASERGRLGAGRAASYKIGYSNAVGVGNGFREEQLCTAKAEALVVGSGPSRHLDPSRTPMPGPAPDIRDLIAKRRRTRSSSTRTAQTASTRPSTRRRRPASRPSPSTPTSPIPTRSTSRTTSSTTAMRAPAGCSSSSAATATSTTCAASWATRPTLDRHVGVMKALDENPGITLLPSKDGVGTDWDPAKGTELTNGIINDGDYDTIQGIWTSGIDQQVVDAIKAAGKPFVPIVGADLQGLRRAAAQQGAATTTASRASPSTTRPPSVAPASSWRSTPSTARPPTTVSSARRDGASTTSTCPAAEP